MRAAETACGGGQRKAQLSTGWGERLKLHSIELFEQVRNYKEEIITHALKNIN